MEALFHATAKRPVVRYAVLGRMLGKMPSYLRRAAIEQAHGAVASYLANYGHFLDGKIGGKARAEGAKPPRLGFSNVKVESFETGAWSRGPESAAVISPWLPCVSALRPRQYSGSA